MGKGKQKLSNCCGAPPQGETSKGAGRCSRCKDGAMFECKIGDTVSGHGADWKVEILFQNGSLVARDINTGDLRKFSAQEAEEFTKVMGSFGGAEDTPVIDPGSDLSPLEQHAELMTPEQLDAFISGGHDLSKVPPRRGNPRRHVEHCGHCPEDFVKWVKRFPEDDDASYQARLEKAADVGFEGLEDEELTPAGLQRKRAVWREGHYESAKDLVTSMLPEVEGGFAGGDMFVDFVRNQVIAGFLQLKEQGAMPSEEDWQIVSQYIGPEATEKLAALKSADENAVNEIVAMAQDFYGKIRESDEDDYEPIEGDEGSAEAQYGPGDDIDVEVGDRVRSSYGKHWVTGTGVVGGLWTSEYRDDVESGRGRGLRPSYVTGIQKGGRGPWYDVHFDRDTDSFTVKSNVLDVATLRDENDNPLMSREDPKFDEALRANAPEGATHAYFVDVGNDDGALIAYTSSQVHPAEIVNALSSSEYGIDASPSQVQLLTTLESVSEAEWTDDEDYKRKQGDWAPDEQPGAADPLADEEPSAVAGDTEGLDPHETNFPHGQGYPNINRRGLTPEKVVRIDTFGDIDFGSENYREDDPAHDGSNPQNYPAVVTLYDVTRDLGGHEEGGWWYDWKTAVKSVAVNSPEEAQAAARQLYGLIGQADLDGKPVIELEKTAGAIEAAQQRPRYENLEQWSQRHGNVDSLQAGFDFPLNQGDVVTVTRGFRANRGYMKPGTLLTFAGLSAYSVLFTNEHNQFVRVSRDKLQYLKPSPVGGSIQREESVEKLVHNLLGESTVEMTVTRTDANDQEFEIPVEVELDMIPGSRGSRDSLGGVRGAGPPLEPDEPATAEVIGVVVLDDELAAKFPNLELTSDEEDRAIEQALEAASDW
jgi:hypothetical protein